ncbi:MAG: tetratricopeptide repeat protein [Phycisphaerae bacterium]|nr:tetratricopeptide repeat protein [Phycisphaerae bacterium]
MNPPNAERPRQSGQPGARRGSNLRVAFGHEPELISACLEGLEASAPERARQILKAAQAALSDFPDYADLHYHASRAALAAGEYETATRLLESALRVNPGYVDALLLAARVALQGHRLADARRHLETARDRGADYPDLHMLMGGVCCKEGNWQAARAEYERALELNANLAEARAALAALRPEPRSGTDDELPA